MRVFLCALALFSAAPGGTRPSYDQIYDGWVDSLIAAYQTPSEDLKIPDSMPRRSPIKRWWNGSKVRAAVLGMSLLKNRRVGDAFLRRVERRVARNPEGKAARVRGILDDYLGDIENLRKRYGTEFLQRDTVSRAVVNVIAMRMNAAMNGRPVDQAQRDAMNAIALLHPITDEALDAGKLGRSTLQKLTLQLQGVPPTAETAYERIVFDLVDAIYHEYPRDRHPVLDWALGKLHEEQIKSVRQKDSDLPERELLRVTLGKGALTRLISGYLALGSLDEKQQAYFFLGGGVFQLLDDWVDIGDDEREGNGTVWTRALAEHDEVEEPLRRLLALQRFVESTNPAERAGFPAAAQMNEMYRGLFQAGLIKGLHRNPDPRVRKSSSVLAPYLPAHPRSLIRLYESVDGTGARLAPRCHDSWALLIRANELY
jgi:hypothetical protein